MMSAILFNRSAIQMNLQREAEARQLVEPRLAIPPERADDAGGERGENFARTGDEAVQLEGKEGVLAFLRERP